MPRFWPFGEGEEQELDEFQVYPQAGDAWAYQGPRYLHGEGFPRRRDAIIAAREARGDRRHDVFYGDGTPAGERVAFRGPERLVLLRQDGTLVGEIDEPLREGAPGGG